MYFPPLASPFDDFNIDFHLVFLPFFSLTSRLAG
jgi:hypothetical protein